MLIELRPMLSCRLSLRCRSVFLSACLRMLCADSGWRGFASTGTERASAHDLRPMPCLGKESTGKPRQTANAAARSNGHWTHGPVVFRTACRGLDPKRFGRGGVCRHSQTGIEVFCTTAVRIRRGSCDTRRAAGGLDARPPGGYPGLSVALRLAAAHQA